MLRVAGLVVALLLAGCGQSYVYMRADGQDFGADPALYKQFETDSMVCQGETHRGGSPTGHGYNVAAGSGAAKDCMAAKGYLVVQSDLVDLKRQELAAKAVGAPEAAAAANGVAMERSKSSARGAAPSRPAPVAPAADAQSVLEQCSRISDKAARLLCFDRVTAKSSDNRR
jgi:hypothetical protein